ncbi:hypothetical protein SAMN04489798_3062 [Pseudomonas arsenicoxydans]|uniref:Uncharacterized protein n=1 Tax=Pseudomonas arsenicoxydans TaxID=702115 RepID=A0A1H0JWH0_9PSED|nr:hypothetical protein SAMN04489798_3062 [Pseudomonas arsenicoxydans]
MGRSQLSQLGGIGTGVCKRWRDSQPSEPMATSKITALIKLARIEPRRQPSVVAG